MDKDLQSGSYYKSLTRNMVLIMILVSFTPLILISGALRFYFSQSYHDKVLDHLTVLIKKHRQNIDTFLYEKLADIRSLAKTGTYQDFTNEDFLRDRLNILQEEYGTSFVDLGVVDDHGIQIAYAGPYHLRNADYSKANWFKESMQTENYISDVFPGLRGIPHFIVAVRKEHGGKNWILRATVDFEAFNSLVESIRIGETGFAFILNKRGEFQTKPRNEVLASRNIYLDFLGKEKLAPDLVVVAERADDSGTESVHVMAPLKHGEWVLAFKQKESDAYMVLYQAGRLAVSIIIIGGLGIVGAAIILSKRMVRYIQDADRQKEMMNEQVIEAGKLASIGELAAGIAHEINNPVAIMVEEAGWIEDLLLEEDLRQTENLDEFKRALTQIRTQGRRCKEITHKLLSFARKTDPTVRKVQLNEMIEDVVGLSEQRARYSNVKMNMHLEPDLPMVKASPSEIQQVLLNLINNALDAIDTKGGNIEITSRINGDFVVVDVADDGPGIAKANLQRIFDPFFTTKPVGKGTGLGLSICYGIVKKMGGEISVNSAVGVGTTFHVHMPVPREPVAPSETKTTGLLSAEHRTP